MNNKDEDANQEWEDMLDSNGYLELCIGPMFAGKTTHLLQIIEQLKANEIEFVVIKPIIDKRYSDSEIVSHDKISYPCISVHNLCDVSDNDIRQHILIEEGQFFMDLHDMTQQWLEQGKNIYIAGLNGDSNMKPFGDICKLIPFADKIIHKHAICECGEPASFTSRLSSNSNRNKMQILIGGNDVYKPTCRACH